MSIKQLVEGDCGGANPLVQFGELLSRDVAHKDEGMHTQQEFNMHQNDRMVNEFLSQIIGPPQSFRMGTLLQEMRDIEKSNLNANQQVLSGPRVIDEVADEWFQEFNVNNSVGASSSNNFSQQIMHTKSHNKETALTPGFFNNRSVIPLQTFDLRERQMYQCTLQPFMQPRMLQSDAAATEYTTAKFFEEIESVKQSSCNDWSEEFQVNKEKQKHETADFNDKFWQNLQEKWCNMSADDYSWIPDFEENDYMKEYQFSEENPMKNISNALERGKEYLAKSEIPSAVLCFEEAVKQEPENAEAWELLGITQAENEMDPQAIAALRRSLELHKANPRAIMALAVCYTNENLPSQAVKLLTDWLIVHPKYKDLVPSNFTKEMTTNDKPENSFISSLIQNDNLEKLQNYYLEVVRLKPNELNADIQEALGVLYNLSSDYDKAVDCFKAALSVQPENAKLWNRLGASLANGSRSVEAVEAYKNALAIEPGFIRARYNVGVCCLNLKAYKEAAEHLITALNIQSNAIRDIPEEAASIVAKGEHHMSETIWSTLKMIVHLMDRNDLHDLVKSRDLKALNEAFPF